MSKATTLVDQNEETARDAVLFPPAPRTLEQAGLSHDLIVQLVLKMLHFGADYSGGQIADKLGLEYSAVEPVLNFLKQTHQCEVFGGSMVGGPSFQYRITDAGRRRAILFLEQSHYIGVAPVPLATYQKYMHAHAAALPKSVNRDRVRKAFSHLVLSDRVLDQVGPAVAAGHSMFVYGPPGNGKTVIAQAIRNLLDGEILIPHALEVEGQIIRLYDPVNHEPIADAGDDGSLWRGERIDGRWVRCRRPMVMVGGELTLQSLELAYSSTMGFYTAPVQAVANGGVLVIDDFGRQHCSPRDLLNRWIVPLESRVDFLTLQTGQKLELPFNVLVVFATNIKPSELVDEAFLRRIHYKVLAENPTSEDFTKIFSDYCRTKNLAFDRSLTEHLIERYLGPRNIRLRGCHPRDLIEQAMAHAEYVGAPRELTIELLEAACAGYFVDDENAAS
ncbi:MAG TPA: ATP-binding protein [Vicinamibacterales bacterium]|nr:ATP-binding protein [Vicinamibacterales bacterium]